MPLLNALYIMNPDEWPRIYGPDQQAEISRLVHVLGPVLSPQQALQDPELLRDMEVLLSGWGGPLLDRHFLSLAPRVEAVFYGAGSARYMLTEAFWERKIVITTANAANAIPVAEFTLAHIILGLKRALYQAAETKKNRAFPEARLPVAGGFGSTVGLISLSTIGRLVRQRLKSFDLKVAAYDPTVSAEQARAFDVEPVTLAELFARSDVVSLHAPHLPETEGLVTGPLLASMKPGATFINTARGAIVRELEMIEVQRQRPDLTVVLDVTDPEPPPATCALFDLPNVFVTPHIAGSVERECQRMGHWAAEELRRYLAGEPLIARLDPEQAASVA